MPQMGESIAEGTLSKWLKKVGDEVKRDEPIFEISTDKVDAEIPSPVAGVLAEVIVTEGQTVAVQTVVARIETEKGAAIAAAPSPSVPAVAAAGERGPPPKPQGTPEAVAVSHRSPAPAIATTGGNGLEERLRTKSSPLVRKIAAEHGIEIAQMQGTGIAGRVTKRDIESYLASGATAAPGRSMHTPLGVEQYGPAPEPWAGDRVEPMTKIRALTSDHMVAARRSAAHVTSFFEIDLTRVGRLRQKARAQFEAETGQKLTYLPYIISAVVDSLKQFPVLNAAVSGTSIIYRKPYNIGIAVALDWGLIVPVIKNANDLSLSGLTKTLNDLAERARTKRLKPEEVQGATFTITNPGVFGSLAGTPIIPLGTSAILGLGAIEKRPKVITGADGEDTIAIRTCAYFSLSFDHRIVDGADADKFLASLKKGLESFPDAAR
ncbi:MAG: 2-oxoglutarate dehydrogenase, E2 component, dihydrolipoamide succinyltransferase [Gemmatimonadetes bacterium]|nr:MAG: 2-oxoglutarate dehydrogenase, E2 component, dihydrolipoamide succinyltransferase [Gemmatimonadota bacterium]